MCNPRDFLPPLYTPTFGLVTGAAPTCPCSACMAALFFLTYGTFLGVNPSTQLSSAQIYPEVTLSQVVTQQYSPIEVQLGALWRWGPRDGGSEVRLLPITTCSAPEGSQSSSALCHKQGCCPSWGYFRVFLTLFTTFSCLLARFGNQMRCLFYPSISPSLHKEK